MTVELSEAAPVQRPLLETAEATEEADDVGIAEEAGEDGSRSPDSMSTTEGKRSISHNYSKELDMFVHFAYF